MQKMDDGICNHFSMLKDQGSSVITRNKLLVVAQCYGGFSTELNLLLLSTLTILSLESLSLQKRKPKPRQKFTWPPFDRILMNEAFLKFTQNPYLLHPSRPDYRFWFAIGLVPLGFFGPRHILCMINEGIRCDFFFFSLHRVLLCAKTSSLDRPSASWMPPQRP